MAESDGSGFACYYFFYLVLAAKKLLAILTSLFSLPVFSPLYSLYFPLDPSMTFFRNLCSGGSHCPGSVN